MWNRDGLAARHQYSFRTAAAKADPERCLLRRVQPLELLFVSIVTFAEIRCGIERVSDATHRAELTGW
jgi:hypothetical protein